MTTLIGSLRINTTSSTIFHYPIKTANYQIFLATSGRDISAIKFHLIQMKEEK